MTVEFGIIELARSLDSALEHAALAESVGFSLIGVADSQSLYRDLYVTAGAIAARTGRVRIGPAVTNPATRHPAVAAGAIATVDEASGGRAMFGIGSGDSAVLNLGERPLNLAGMREYVTAWKALVRGESTEWRGKSIHTEWIPRPVPLYLSAEGPKTLELAGELADGVICGLGISPEAIDLTLGHLARGAERAGRTLDDLDIWALTRVNIGDDRRVLIDEIRMELASTAHHAFRFTLEGKGVPPAFVERIAAVQAGYQTRRHEALGESPNAALMQDLQFLEYMVDRFAVVGSPRECARQLARASEAGISQFLFTGFVADRAGLIRALGQEVLASLR